MISHHHKCVFVHIPKNAGQSIEHVFFDLLGLTYETRAPLLMRANDRPELGPPRLAHLKWHQYVDCKYMPQEQFDAYFKFSFVRNPWDRAVSIYKYYKFHKRCSFPAFVAEDLSGWMWQERHWFVGPQVDFVCDRDGALKVDFLGRFENLQQDFDQVCRAIPMPATKLPHVNISISRIEPSERQAKASVRARLGHLWNRRKEKEFPTYPRFQDYYDPASRALVEKLYGPDIDRFGYEFETPALKASA